MSDDLSGRTLGRYQVLERLGRGGMAEVYRAYQPGLDRYVAIKVIYPHLAGDPNLRERFGREARAVATLRHPNIVQVHDFDMQGDMAFMAMEFISGPTLKAATQSLVRRGRLLPLPVVGQIVGQLADALAYAHEQQVIHRDVKPANVLLRRRSRPEAVSSAGQTPLDADAAIDELILGLAPDSVVLTDFGVARVISDSVEQTAAGTILGSPAYMAPEQGRGERADARSDIYSLGVVLYELLTGQVPFDADTPFAIVIKHIQAPLPPPRARRPDLPEGLERVLLKALAKDPADRFQDAGAFGAAVREEARQPGLAALQQAPGAPAMAPDSATRYIADLHGTRVAEATPLPAPPASQSEQAGRPTLTPDEAKRAPVAGAPPKRRSPLRRGLGCLAILGVVGVLMLVAFAAGGATVFRGLGTVGALTVPTRLAAEVTAAAARGTSIPFLDPVPATPPPAGVGEALAAGLKACEAPGCPGGSASDAIAVYDQAISAFPESAPLYAARAQAYVWWDPFTYRGQIEGDLEKALDLDENSAAAYLARASYGAVVAKDDGDRDSAAEDFTRAIELDPGLLNAYLGRAALFASAPGFYEPDPSVRDNVIADATAALAIDPRSVQALLLRGNAYAGANQHEQALADFSAALAIEPANLDALMRRGDVLRYAKGDMPKALADYSAAVNTAPDDGDARRARAGLLIEMGDPAAARADADELVRSEPANPELYTMRGLISLKLGDPKAALADFDQALAIAGPDDVAARYGRGKALIESGDAAAAVADLAFAAEQADALDTVWYMYFAGHRQVLIDLAQAYLKTERRDEARKALDRSVESESSWHLPYLLRGKLHAAAGEPARARADLRRALELAPDDAVRAEIDQALRRLP